VPLLYPPAVVYCCCRMGNVNLLIKLQCFIFGRVLTFCAFLLRDASIKLGLSRHAVCPSVTFVHSVKTNKHIFKLFSPSGRPTILVFHTKRDGNTPTKTPLTVTGASNARGMNKKLCCRKEGAQCFVSL